MWYKEHFVKYLGFFVQYLRQFVENVVQIMWIDGQFVQYIGHNMQNAKLRKM